VIYEALVFVAHNTELVTRVVDHLRILGVDVSVDCEEPRYLGWGLNRVIGSDSPLHGTHIDNYQEFIDRTVEAYPWLSVAQISEYRADVIVNDLIQELKIKKK
jgi:hypothetical protein